MKNKEVADYLVNWLQEKVTKAGAKGIIFGNSGGIDSAVAGILAKRAFPENCLGLILPCYSSEEDVTHAKELADNFDITSQTIVLDNIYDILCLELDKHLKYQNTNIELVKANVKPRLRMIALYYLAQNYNYLVMGTTNKSEMKVGYTTKHGDSGVDLQLLADLVKLEIYELASYLKVPTVIIEKPPSAGLWEGQTDEEEMGINYLELDSYIRTGQGDKRVIEIVENLAAKSNHKRSLAAAAIIPKSLLT